MRYEWYIDLYLLINLLMDAGLLWSLGKSFSDTAALEADRVRCGIWSSGSLWRSVDTAAVFGYWYKNGSAGGKSFC